MSLTVASSSADPASSFLNLWALLKPALDYVMTSEDPKLDYALYITIHDSLYKYFAKQQEADCIGKEDDLPGHGLYVKLDEYFQHTCQDILLASPEHESELVTYVVSTFQRYTERAFVVQRMTNYVNQHYVRRAFNEERGWLNAKDVLRIAYASCTSDNLAGGSDQRTIAQMKADYAVLELKKWGYKDGDSKLVLKLLAH